MDNNTVKRTYYTALVIGPNHKEIIEKYSHDKKTEPYVKYRYLDAGKYLANIKKVLSSLCENWKVCGLSKDELANLKDKLSAFENMSSFEYYKMLTEGLHYDEEGNAISDENPNAKFLTCKLGSTFSIPFSLIDGSEKYSATKGEIDWSIMHGYNADVYRRAWEIIVDGSKPQTDEENKIAKAMKGKKNYFSNFSDVNDYIAYSTSFWAYAIVTEDGWKDVDSECNGDMTKWIGSFYDTFIKGLDDGEMLTIYECHVL